MDTVKDWSVIKTEDWLQNHHPVGQLPYFEDTDAGIELFESRAIAKCECTLCKSQAFSPCAPRLIESSLQWFEAKLRSDICLKYKSPLMPTTENIVAFAKFETACSMEFANFEAFATRITYELIFKKG